MYFVRVFSLPYPAIGTAARYRIDGPGIETRWRRNFPHPSRTDMGPNQPLLQEIRGLFPGVKRPEHVVNHPTPTSAEAKEKVEL